MKKPAFLQVVRQWLAPGIGLKRWLLVMVAGAIVMGMGFVYLLLIIYRAGILPEDGYNWLMLGFLPLPWRVILPFVGGFLLVALATVRLGANLLEPFRRPGQPLVSSLYHFSRRDRGPQIVAIGGGTGLPSLLRGLKSFTNNITAIVTVADDGGSSGRLRQELGVLPPGDFRNNLAALSDDEALMTQVLQYRFGAGVSGDAKSELRGHAFGNLLLVALAGVTGSFDEALLAAERVLALRGRVLPSTLEQVALVADVESPSGAPARQTQRVVGESAIPQSGGRILRVYLEPADVRAYPPAIQAILQADLVVVGPGSLFTSILPNLLVPGVADALRHTRARTVYICNLATQPGETDSFTLADHVDVLTRHVDRQDWLDVVVANDNLHLPPGSPGNTRLVEPAWPPAHHGNMRLVTADLLDEKRPWQHDSEKLAAVLKSLEEAIPTGSS